MSEEMVFELFCKQQVLLVYALESTNQLQRKEFGMHLLGCSWRFTLNALPI